MLSSAFASLCPPRHLSPLTPATPPASLPYAPALGPWSPAGRDGGNLPESPPVDDRSAIAKALALVATITAVGVEMVLPVLLGLWLDRWLGTKVWLTIGGAALGLFAGIWHLVKLLPSAPGKRPRANRHDHGQPPP